MTKRLILLICTILLSGCGQVQDELIVISEKWPAEHISDIHFNPRSYEGKTIRIMGFYDDTNYYGEPSNFVYKSLECCGIHDVAGLEFIWDGELPQTGSYIQVTGIARIVDDRVVLVDVELEVLE